jgi:hypothetical protein
VGQRYQLDRQCRFHQGGLKNCIIVSPQHQPLTRLLPISGDSVSRGDSRGDLLELPCPIAREEPYRRVDSEGKRRHRTSILLEHNPWVAAPRLRVPAALPGRYNHSSALTSVRSRFDMASRNTQASPPLPPSPALIRIRASSINMQSPVYKLGWK